ncbi:hypothetical protein ABK040_006164 [Willaertia magna]
MLLDFLFLFLYLALLVLGAWCVSEGADILGEKYDASIIGGIIISSLNTAPETIFFITALNSNQPNFAVGAISGSVIVVCTIAVGLCLVIGANARTTNHTNNAKKKRIVLFPQVLKQAKFLLFSLIFVFLTLCFGFQLFIGLFGALAYLSFIFYTLFTTNTKNTHHHHHPHHVNTNQQHHNENSVLYHDELHNDEEEEEDSDEDEEEQPTYKGIFYLILGGILIYFFSDPFIQSVVFIGKERMGISPLSLAFFFAPIASEAPEILESISLSRKGKLQNINIAFSNLVGGTLSKTTLLTGILSFYGVYNNFEWISPAYTVSMFLLMICAGAVGAFGFMKYHSALSGYILLGLFLVCAFSQFLVAIIYGSESVLTVESI